jgi:hypothetical protein
VGRQSLRITIVLGVLVTLMGSTGIFAVFTDRATSGLNEVTSLPRPKAADLRIEVPMPVEMSLPVVCDTNNDGVSWLDDSTEATHFLSLGMVTGDNLSAHTCLRNVGSGWLDVTASVIDLVDLDTACTGDEAASGDASCGLDASGAPQAGELSPNLLTRVERVDCQNPAQELTINGGAILSEFIARPVLGLSQQLAPDEVACFRIDVVNFNPELEQDAQLAQSDTVRWRFAFDGTAQ